MYHVSAQGVDERMINVHYFIIIIIIIIITWHPLSLSVSFVAAIYMILDFRSMGVLQPGKVGNVVLGVGGGGGGRRREGW